MKGKLVIMALLLLAGCQVNGRVVEESVSTIVIEPQTNSEVKRMDDVRQAMTDYSEYAQPNAEGFAYYVHNDPDVSSEVIPLDGNSSTKVVLFTFDDAPRVPNSHVLRMAETLKAKDVNAVFLANGMYLLNDEGREMLRKIHDMGFEIGNHTQTHPNLRELTYEEQYAEIEETNRLIYEITGEKVRWFRPPFGKFNYDTINICNDLDLQLMNWSFGYDWMEVYQEGTALANVSLNNDYLRAGANILMHDLPWTADALDRLVDGYRQQGYHIVDPYLIIRQENSTAPLNP